MLFIVGKGKALFRVHKNLLIEKSSFFKAAFENMRFKEGVDQKMELVEEDEEVFDLFVRWLYEGKYGLPKLEGLEKDDTNVILSVKLYVFADARDIEDLQQELIIQLVEAIDRENPYAPSKTVVRYVYSSVTADTSVMRELMADWSAWRMGADWSKAELVQVPAFAAELIFSLKYFSDYSSRSAKFSRDADDYAL